MHQVRNMDVVDNRPSPVFTVHYPLEIDFLPENSLSLEGSIRGLSGSNRRSLMLIGERDPRVIPPSIISDRPETEIGMRPAQEFRYKDVHLAAHPKSHSDDEAERSRSFSSTFDYQALQLGLRWSPISEDRFWFTDGAINVRFDRLAVDINEIIEPYLDPAHASLAATALSLGFEIGAGLRLTEAASIRLGVDSSTIFTDFNDVQRSEASLVLSYRITPQLGFEFGNYRYVRLDEREVSSVRLRVSGARFGVFYRL